MRQKIETNRCIRASLVAQTVKNPPTIWELWGLSPGLGRSPGGGHGNPLQYSCLESPMDREDLEATEEPRGCKESDMTDRLSTG